MKKDCKREKWPFQSSQAGKKMLAHGAAMEQIMGMHGNKTRIWKTAEARRKKAD